MHCAINAVSVGVPTIFLAYSKKAYGMVEYVYGNSKWVVPLKDVKNTDMVSLINEIMAAEPHLFDQGAFHQGRLPDLFPSPSSEG